MQRAVAHGMAYCNTWLNFWFEAHSIRMLELGSNGWTGLLLPGSNRKFHDAGSVRDACYFMV